MQRVVPQLLHQAARRSYATQPTAKSGGGSSPLVIGGAALAAIGGVAYYFQSTGKDPMKTAIALEDKAKSALNDATGKVTSGAQTASGLVPALNKDEWRDFEVAKVAPYNHNTSVFTFKLPEGTDSGLTVASALLTKSADEGKGLDKNGKPAVRPYTPTTAPGTQGEIQLIIKKYKGGAMTEHIHSLKAGDKLAMKGPIPKIAYKANEFETIGMVGGGSGITPLWQVMQAIDNNPADKTKVVLLYSNVTEQDILLRKEFEDMAKRKPDQFKIHFVLDKPPKKWAGPTGYIGPVLLKDHMPMPGNADKIKILICGPPGQVEILAGTKKSPSDQGPLKGHFADLGYSPSQIYKF
ncbi:uncharacterized protein L969DRAFT_95304 [Mixia osmundae IAM 14324]|uniref:NADH-cytochrome b5 reductase n=1 Tax=Mixia osmundae (strain CBS 9802 / IAM 14324 / JCM 22182 / KY 12970) TaxID=764103 RepID=G7EAM7_MIXOS|nr:uncharacterized protein L969DRAFT_95304 [Mixia osmundae IAM 14324]KEI38206.1 hypothetical protein L969DRAFT_95304 [Mixia osmundae IAM 14324]GAA99887.1 hypothetical protein E5Q_06590 [Mixia osmundae IAM 14324]